MKIKKICCIGAGYVGGPSMAVIANHCEDIQINVVDINKQKIDSWNNIDVNLIPIYEPGLKEIINKCRGVNLHFSTNIERNIREADIIFITVNTPTKITGIGAGQASDVSWIEQAARQISKFSKGTTIVVEKSTIPVRTASIIKSILQESCLEARDKKFMVLSNPEFLSEGTAIQDLEKPDRVLIGGEDDYAIEVLKNIYERWIKSEKIIKTKLWSAELSKLTSNAFLAQRVSSINSISSICEVTGADINEVSSSIGLDSRIGQKFLKSGPGFGGSCFKKDILNLVYLCNFYGLNEVADYWNSVLKINNWQQKRIYKKIVEKLYGNLNSKKISILGFSFKADTNDTRESPAIYICNKLLEEGANLSIYDPKVNRDQIRNDLKEENFNQSSINSSKIIIANSIEESIHNADAILILTEWKDFTKINWAKVTKTMRRPSWIFDTRDCVSIKAIKDLKINLWKLGKSEYKI